MASVANHIRPKGFRMHIISMIIISIINVMIFIIMHKGLQRPLFSGHFIGH